MRLLLDTHVLLWALGEPDRLPAEPRRVLENIDNEPWFSTARIWEIAIKSGLGRFDFRVSAQRILYAARQSGSQEAVIASDTAVRVADLPPHHRDPLDRLLIVRAMAYPMRLYTANSILSGHSDLVTVIG